MLFDACFSLDSKHVKHPVLQILLHTEDTRCLRNVREFRLLANILYQAQCNFGV
jgi:hypothetical protein